MLRQRETEKDCCPLCWRERNPMRRILPKLLTLICLLVAIMGLSIVTAHAATVTGTISGGNEYRYHEDKSPVPGWGSYTSTKLKYFTPSGGGSTVPAYCMEPSVGSASGSLSYSSVSWSSLRTDQRYAITLAMAYGYGGAYGFGNIHPDCAQLATQAVIWEFVCDFRDTTYPYTLYDSTCAGLFHYAGDGVAAAYDMIIDRIMSHGTIPSFAVKNQRQLSDANAIELTWDGSQYSASVTDTNGALPEFRFTCNISGVNITQRGNTLTVTATKAATAQLNGYISSDYGYSLDVNGDEAVLLEPSNGSNYQACTALTEIPDPIVAYIHFKVSIVEENGSLTINKVDADTGKALAGVTYRLFDSAGNKIADAITGTNGKAVFADLPLGSYSYQEISAPSGYVVDSTKYPITITASALDITATRTNALGKAGVEISKVDADSKSPLQGAGFRLFDASGSQVAEGYTDANGKLSFTGLKLGSYTCKEFQAPTGYELDETAFPVTLNQNEQVLKVTRENKLITGSIEILKVDADTKQPLSGVVYRLFDTEGNKIADGTTDANGKVTFNNLKPGSYSYQEISTVDGYQLDETKYGFSLTGENLSIKVTRENKPVKGCLTVRKMDVTGSPLAGAELLLETSTDGKNWTEVSKITTDKTGVAKWDDLKIGVQYRITEVKAPAGYTLMTEPLFTGTLDNTNPDVTITACNSAGFVLPFTGGVGFTPYILFAALMLCMGVYFCKKSEFTNEPTR